MSALDETSEFVSRLCFAGLGWWQTRGACHRAIRLCFRGIVEHAARYLRDAARFSRIGRSCFLYWFSSLAAIARDGFLAPALLLNRACRRSAHFPSAQHGDGRLLRHPCLPVR